MFGCLIDGIAGATNRYRYRFPLVARDLVVSRAAPITHADAPSGNQLRGQ